MRNPYGIFRRRSSQPLPDAHLVYTALKADKGTNWTTVCVGVAILVLILIVISQIV
mgnify:CR=1